MVLKNTIRLINCLPKFRAYSTASPLVNVAINEKTGVATATLQRPPVNSLNLELITAIGNTLKDLETNKCRGLILTSVNNKYN